jgi:hypothetical protein
MRTAIDVGNSNNNNNVSWAVSCTPRFLPNPSRVSSNLTSRTSLAVTDPLLPLLRIAHADVLRFVFMSARGHAQ